MSRMGNAEGGAGGVCTARWGQDAIVMSPEQPRPCCGAGEGAGCEFWDLGHLLLTLALPSALGSAPLLPAGRAGRRSLQTG